MDFGGRLGLQGMVAGSVQADRGIPTAVVPIFEKHIRERVSELLVDLDNWLSPYAAQDEPGIKNVRVGLAVFQFVDPEPELSSLREKVAPDQ